MKIFLDSADPVQIHHYYSQVDGFTTNPSLLRQAGQWYKNYREFADSSLKAANGKPISFEVFADDLEEMEKQARIIASWAANIYVKIPVTNCLGESTGHLIRKLSGEGLKLNITAVMTHDQIRSVARSLYPLTPSILSIFCGRIADCGKDPVSFITTGVNCQAGKTEILWASTRELYNLKQAELAGADIITVTPAILAKKYLIGKDLSEYSLETVRQFHRDAEGLTL